MSSTTDIEQQEASPSAIQPAATADVAGAAPSMAALAPRRGERLRLWRHKERVLLLLDLLVIYGTFMAVYYARFHIWPGSITVAPTDMYWKTGALLAAVWVILMRHNGAYETGLRGVAAPILRVRTLVACGLYATGVLMVVSFLFGGTPLSRLTCGITFFVASAELIAMRAVARRIDRLLADRGAVCSRIVVGGVDEQARDFCVRLRALGSTTRVTGFLRLSTDQPRLTLLACPVFGALEDVRQVYDASPFDVLVLSDAAWSDSADFDQHVRMDLLNFCESRSIQLYVLPSSYDIAVTRREVASMSGLPLIRLEDAARHTVYPIVKRAMDVVIALMVIVLGLPLWAAIMLAIKLTDRGPVFFTQTRTGLHGRPFRMYKFRSMCVDAEAKLQKMLRLESLDEPVFKIKNDPRVTAVGRFLRRTSLDEVPQFLNVLIGNMSVVGPRPEEQRLVDRYNPHQRRRLKAVPGITGLQQVECRGDQSLQRRIACDLIYMKHQGLLLDIYIMLRTVKEVLRGSGRTH
jgi:exopolysaccharide biosynthesis polyprenyl glycosylphosphotransferase